MCFFFSFKHLKLIYKISILQYKSQRKLNSCLLQRPFPLFPHTPPSFFFFFFFFFLRVDQTALDGFHLYNNHDEYYICVFDYLITSDLSVHRTTNLKTASKQGAELEATSELLEAFLQTIANLIGGAVIDIVSGLAGSSLDALVDVIVRAGVV